VILIVILLAIVSSFSILYAIRTYLAGDKLSTGDTFFHLLIVESIRKHQWKYPSSLQNVIFDYDIKPYNYLAYPHLFHYIVALFPIRCYLTVAKILGLVILSFLSSIPAVFVYGITSNSVLAILASFIATFNLSAFENTVAFNPRSLGLLLYSLVVYIAVLCPENLFSILAIAFIIMLINLAHKFATQVVILGLLPYVFIFGRLYYLSSIALGFLLSIFLSRGFYLKILKEHYCWLYYYSLYPKENRVTSRLISIFSRNCWYLLIIASMIYFFIFKNEGILYDNLMGKASFWAFIPVLIALLVSIPRLSFLGEDYRYVQYSVAPVGIVSSLYMESSPVYVWVIFLACVSMSFFALFKLKRYLQHSNDLVNPGDVSSYHFLRNYNPSYLLVFPHIRTLEVNYFADLNVVHLVRPKSPWTSEHIENLLNKYGIQFVLKFKGDSHIFEKLKDTVHINKTLTFTNFEVYKLTPKNPTILKNRT